MKIYTPIALKLHSFGLKRLHDPNWTGMDLYDHMKGIVRRGNVLTELIERGFLFQLGELIFNDYMIEDEHLSELDGEYLIWYLEDYVNFLTFHKVDPVDKSLSHVTRLVAEVGDLFDRDEDAYFHLLESYRRRNDFIEFRRKLTRAHSRVIKSVSHDYSANYADRVFHDRELCAYIAELLVTIGFDGVLTDEDPHQWVDRTPIPEWAKKALYARDRGRCALCSTDMLQELNEDVNIDHIVPLSRGGCNDLVNLQLLCNPCNRRKSNKKTQITSSIPPYIQRRISRE